MPVSRHRLTPLPSVSVSRCWLTPPHARQSVLADAPIHQHARQPSLADAPPPPPCPSAGTG
eukprot:15474199-Alexandrium_andersonii.AAC.1